MRFLADENIPRRAVEVCALGHDVVWACETMSGQADVVLVEEACRQDRIIVTFDKDFGELAFRRGLSGASGVQPCKNT